MCVHVDMSVCVREPYADAATVRVGNEKLMRTTHRIDFIITFFRVTIIFCVRHCSGIPVRLSPSHPP